MNWLQCIIYGLVSGLSEFMPVSSLAHQQILRELFGIDRADVVQELFIHISALAALFYGCNNLFDQIKRGSRIPRHNKRHADASLDIRLVKTAAAPMLIIYLIIAYSIKQITSLPLMTLFLILNGIITFISSRMLQGNKDARSMSKMDAFLLGSTSALSALPGFSRVGIGTSFAISRGADRLHALNWSLLLSIPVLILFSGMDLVGLFSAANLAEVTGNVLGYFLSACGSFAGGYAGILLMRFLAVKVGFSGFVYYSWGAALFTFVLYLL